MPTATERLSKLQRRLTPPVLADYLVAQVRIRTSSVVVAALWVDERGPYMTIPGVEAWTKTLDARRYAGPWPVICHPPCGPWGKFAWKCTQQSAADGELAMYLVHVFGGVVEQPLGSHLYKQHGCGGTIERINQYDYGFAGLKPTLLYWTV